MRLIDLEPTFYRLGHEVWNRVPTLAEAQGVMFLCPKCFITNGGRVGTHMVHCWFANHGVPDATDPKPGRWNPSGAGFEDLTFVGPGSTSVLITAGCMAHFFVEAGQIRMC